MNAFYKNAAFLFILILQLSIVSCKQHNIIINAKDKWLYDSVYSPLIVSDIEKNNLKNALTKVDSIYFSTGNPNIWLQCFYYTSHCWMNNYMGNPQLSIAYADSFIAIIEKNNLKESMLTNYFRCLHYKGNAYFTLNNFPKAYENYFKAKQIAKQLDEIRFLIGFINDFGLKLYQQKQYKEAIHNFKEAMTYMNDSKVSSTSTIANQGPETLDNIGLSYTKLNMLDSANHYYNLALQNCETYQYNTANDSSTSLIRSAGFKGVVLGNKAKIYIAKNQLDSAEVLYQQAIYLNTTIGIVRSDAQLCQLQLAQLQFQKKNLSGMKKSLDQLKIGLDTLPNAEAKLGWQEMMAAYYNRTNNPAQEIIYYKDFITQRDSINLSKKDLLQTSITKELKDKEQQFTITVLQKDNQLGKLYLWIVAGLVVMALAIIVLVYWNFTKAKANNNVLVKLNRQVNNQKIELEKINKAKDRIMNVVAHDLRNPIGAIANFLDIVTIKYQHSEAEENILNNVQKAAVRSLHLINDLLEVNKIQSGELEIDKAPTDAASLIKQCINQVAYKSVTKQQHILFNSPASTIIINIDEEKIQRVLINLLDNAIKFSFVNTEIVVNLYQQSANIIIEIQDKGMGIPANIKEHLFENSIATKRKGTNNEPSNGLGLSICKQIIDAHKGEIMVTSKEGIGTTFTIHLPNI